MKTLHSVDSLLGLAWLASFGPLYANALFWAFLAQGNTRVAAFIQFAAEQNRPAAQIFNLADYRKAA